MQVRVGAGLKIIIRDGSKEVGCAPEVEWDQTSTNSIPCSFTNSRPDLCENGHNERCLTADRMPQGGRQRDLREYQSRPKVVGCVLLVFYSRTGEGCHCFDSSLHNTLTMPGGYDKQRAICVRPTATSNCGCQGGRQRDHSDSIRAGPKWLAVCWWCNRTGTPSFPDSRPHNNTP